MKYRFLFGLILVGLVITLLSIHQTAPHFSDQLREVSNRNTNTEKRTIHEQSSRMTLPKKDTRAGNDDSDTFLEGEYLSEYGTLPASLQGTRIDGELVADTDGKFIILPSTKKRFDYFLSAVSEEGLETVISRIEENIHKTLPPEAAGEALTILYSYINYKKSLQAVYKNKTGLPENSGQVADIRVIIERRKELRRKYLSPDVVDAFFGEQELYDEFSLKCLELHHDKTLTAEEKQNELRDLEETLPEKFKSRKNKRDKNKQS